VICFKVQRIQIVAWICGSRSSVSVFGFRAGIRPEIAAFAALFPPASLHSLFWAHLVNGQKQHGVMFFGSRNSSFSPPFRISDRLKLMQDWSVWGIVL
jgi:hypothetical protein